MVYVCGDTNSRIGSKSDCINYDILLYDHDYLAMDTFIPRTTTDRGTNRFGEQLLDLCKSTDIRIVNGRLDSDANLGKPTCYTYNGNSVVDYLLTKACNFENISEFRVHDLTAHSNHAPISFSVKVRTVPVVTNPRKRTIYKWNPEYRTEFVNDISRDIEMLCQNLNESKQNNQNPDEMVNIFTTYLSERGNAYFETCCKATVNACFNDNKTNKWFDESCKQKYTVYKNAVLEFNANKSVENRELLYLKKKDYKYHCRKVKRNFDRKQAAKNE
jgi:hypothetical protein